MEARGLIAEAIFPRKDFVHPLKPPFGGKGIRTPDIQLAKLALYQLSYAPGKLYYPGKFSFRRGCRAKIELWVIRHQVVHVFT